MTESPFDVKSELETLRTELAALRRARRRTALLAGLAVLLVVPGVLLAVTVPHTFANGTVADAAQVNANFAALGNAINALPGAPALACTCSSASTGQLSCGVRDVTATLAAGYVRTGGGCYSNAANERQLLRSYPVGTDQWNCRSTDEDNCVGENLTAYVCGCRLQ